MIRNLWTTFVMAWHGFYPIVYMKPHVDRQQVELTIESRFDAEDDAYVGRALMQLGEQMQGSGK
jgi:aromatic ring-opening dioxygenase catalytic subunit (LigB family)